jgi:micrococcal nuclease
MGRIFGDESSRRLLRWAAWSAALAAAWWAFNSLSATPEIPSDSGPPPAVTAPATVTTEVRLDEPDGRLAVVESITDGDTIVVSGGERVRLIGIDAPEPTQDDCYAAEATRFISTLIPPGTRVRLVYDVERVDRYGRTLAYVYRAEDGLFVNAELVARGYAQMLTVPPNVAHADDFLRLQRQARRAGLGLWGACDTTSAAVGFQRSCDPSYPEVCIPPPPPDLDCSDIGHRDFRVVGADPHRFDGNDDGIACET